MRILVYINIVLVFLLSNPIEARLDTSKDIQGQQHEQGPWNNDLWILESEDGNTFSNRRRIIERGGVPSIVRNRVNNDLVLVFQWFPLDQEDSFDKVAVSFSRDEGTSWSTPQTIHIKGLPQDFKRPFDPAIVQLENHSFRLYFTSHSPSLPQPAIYSAISKDAVHYTYETGVRSTGTHESVVDACAIYWNGAWHLYAHPQRLPGSHMSSHAYHGVSQDGLNFQSMDSVSIPEGSQWIGNLIKMDRGIRFYGSGRGGVWSAFSQDGNKWTIETGIRVEGGDPSVFQTKKGQYRMVIVGSFRKDVVKHPFQQQQLPLNENLQSNKKGMRKEEFFKENTKSNFTEEYRNYVLKYDQTKVPQHQCRVFNPPKTVKFGRLIDLSGGGFPRTVYMNDKFYAFTAYPDGYYVKEFSKEWESTGYQRKLTPSGIREVDHDITSNEKYVYHYAMLPGGKGQIRKFDNKFNLIKQTPVFSVGPNDMILDQNIAVFGDKVYASGEYREGTPWQKGEEQNIPPNPRVKRGLHVRIYDTDLNLLSRRNFVAQIKEAVVPHQFWGLGASQLFVDGFHIVVAHSPVGNIEQFSKGESIGARQIFMARFDKNYNFVDSKGPLSDTNRDNFWSTGSWYDNNRYYVVYVSVSKGWVPGPGGPNHIESNTPIESNLRLGIFDKDFNEIETVDITPPGGGGGTPGLLKVGDRLFVSYTDSGNNQHAKAFIRELIIDESR